MLPGHLSSSNTFLHLFIDGRSFQLASNPLLRR